jgi:hypothetical protein
MDPLPTNRTYTVERRTDLDGNDLYFIIPSRDRRKHPKFFRPEEVPPFEGRAATFEIERKGKLWRFVKRVDG